MGVAPSSRKDMTPGYTMEQVGIKYFKFKDVGLNPHVFKVILLRHRRIAERDMAALQLAISKPSHPPIYERSK
jgi:hypothetical protein